MALCLGYASTYQFLGAAFYGDLNHDWQMNLIAGDGLAKTVANIKDSNGRTALHFAAVGRRTHVCRYLMAEAKVDVNARDGKGSLFFKDVCYGNGLFRGETPLHYSISTDHYPTAVHLLENGGNSNAATDKGLAPMLFVAKRGCF